MRLGVTDNIALSPFLGWLQALYYSCSTIAAAHPWHQNVSLPSIMYFCSLQGLWSMVRLWTLSMFLSRSDIYWNGNFKEKETWALWASFFLLENKFTQVSELYPQRVFNIQVLFLLTIVWRKSLRNSDKVFSSVTAFRLQQQLWSSEKAQTETPFPKTFICHCVEILKGLVYLSHAGLRALVPPFCWLNIWACGSFFVYIWTDQNPKWMKGTKSLCY